MTRTSVTSITVGPGTVLAPRLSVLGGAPQAMTVEGAARVAARDAEIDMRKVGSSSTHVRGRHGSRGRCGRGR